MTTLAACRQSVGISQGIRCLGLLCVLAFLQVLSGEARSELRERETSTVYGAEVAVLVDPESDTARHVGRPADVETLARRLIDVVGNMTDYNVKVELPLIEAIPVDLLRQRLCGGFCNIRAAYVPGEGLYFDDSLRPLTDQFDQSILFHELIHHVQSLSGSHGGQGECWKWHGRELEAYSLQNQFLDAIGASHRARTPRKICSAG